MLFRSVSQSRYEKGKEEQRKRSHLQNKPEVKDKIKQILKQIRSTTEYREHKRIEQKKIWSSKELREKQSKIMKEHHEKRRKMKRL